MRISEFYTLQLHARHRATSSIGCLTGDPSEIGTNPAQDGKLINVQADKR
jgi:hypothetical protein